MKLEDLNKEDKILFLSNILFKEDKLFHNDFGIFKDNISILKNNIVDILKNENISNQNYTKLLNYILEDVFLFQELSYHMVDVIKSRNDLDKIIKNINLETVFFPSTLDFKKYAEQDINLTDKYISDTIEKMIYAHLGLKNKFFSKEIFSQDDLEKLKIEHIKHFLPFFTKENASIDSINLLYKRFSIESANENDMGRTKKVLFRNNFLDNIVDSRICKPQFLAIVYDSVTGSEKNKISLAANPNTPSDVLRSLANSNNYSILKNLVKNPSLEPSIMIKFLDNYNFIKNKNIDLLEDLASSSNLSKRVIDKLLNFKLENVDKALLSNKNIEENIYITLVHSIGKNNKSELLSNKNTPKFNINEIIQKGVLSDKDKINLLFNHGINLTKDLININKNTVNKIVPEKKFDINDFLNENKIDKESIFGKKLIKQYNDKLEELKNQNSNEFKKEKELLEKVEALAELNFR